MRTLRSASGPFTERLYFEPNDIENICIDELRKVDLFPREPQPIRIDRFIEKRFSISHEYDELPKGVLGYTKFGPNGVVKIVIARFLSEDGSQVAERRINTTLGHEGGHGLLHAYLFALGEIPRGLFGDLAQNQHRILCRNVAGTTPIGKSSYSGHWWEHQANLAMGALLLPRILVELALEPFLVVTGALGIKTLNDTKRERSIVCLSEVFDVNPIVARIRLQELYPEGSQLNL